MSTHTIYQVDAFTNKLFGGNPAAVIPLESWLDDVLMQQIKDGKSEEEIRKSWEPALSEFKKIRKKYLLYEDFE